MNDYISALAKCAIKSVTKVSMVLGIPGGVCFWLLWTKNSEIRHQIMETSSTNHMIVLAMIALIASMFVCNSIIDNFHFGEYKVFIGYESESMVFATMLCILMSALTIGGIYLLQLIHVLS